MVPADFRQKKKPAEAGFRLIAAIGTDAEAVRKRIDGA